MTSARYSVTPYASASDRWAIVDAKTGCVAVKRRSGRFVQLTFASRERADRVCKELNDEGS